MEENLSVLTIETGTDVSLYLRNSDRGRTGDKKDWRRGKKESGDRKAESFLTAEEKER